MRPCMQIRRAIRSFRCHHRVRLRPPTWVSMMRIMWVIRYCTASRSSCDQRSNVFSNHQSRVCKRIGSVRNGGEVGVRRLS